MKKYLPAFLFVFALLACALPASPVTQPSQPAATLISTLVIPSTQPAEPASTAQPTSTTGAASAPGGRMRLGSPFSNTCGDGIPRIWRNASFNAEMPFDYAAEADDTHGYVTLYPPQGCDAASAAGEVIAPADGELSQFGEYGFALLLPEKAYPDGIEEALKFIGIQNPDLAHISTVQLQFGKYFSSNGTIGPVKKGQSIGDIAVTGDAAQQAAPQLEYQVIINYDNGEGVKSYIVSPTLFQYDGKPWPCVQGSPFPCDPKAGNFKQ
jgi:hypothetical protein